MNKAPSPKDLKIKLFSDGADRASMLEVNSHPYVKGMTTNPSLMKKAGIKDYRGFAKDILDKIKEKPVSFEVFADDFATMEKQALEIKTWGKNVFVKIPICNSLGESAIALIQKLSKQKVNLNITALYTVPQVLGVCEAVKDGAEVFVSVFAGRIADTGQDPLPTMIGCREVCRAFDATASRVQLLWASTREVFNIVQADQMGCDIITAPYDIIKKLENFGRPISELSVDTVKAFKKDSEAAGFAL